MIFQHWVETMPMCYYKRDPSNDVEEGDSLEEEEIGLNDVMCFIHKQFIDSLVSEICEGNESEFNYIVVWFLPMTFENIRRSLQYLDAELVRMLSTVTNSGSDEDFISPSTMMATRMEGRNYIDSGMIHEV